jgi:hypothetical protein
LNKGSDGNIGGLGCLEQTQPVSTSRGLVQSLQSLLLTQPLLTRLYRGHSLIAEKTHTDLFDCLQVQMNQNASEQEMIQNTTHEMEPKRLFRVVRTRSFLDDGSGQYLTKSCGPPPPQQLPPDIFDAELWTSTALSRMYFNGSVVDDISYDDTACDLSDDTSSTDDNVPELVLYSAYSSSSGDEVPELGSHYNMTPTSLK